MKLLFSALWMIGGKHTGWLQLPLAICTQLVLMPAQL